MPNNVTVRPSRYVLPPIESGYVIDPGVGQFSVILPLGADKTNLVSNPSVETNTTGYNANAGGALARDSTVQKFGVYSLKYTPTSATNDGVWYSSVTLVSGTQYVASVWFKGQANLKYLIQFTTSAFAQVGQIGRFTATGYWQRVSCVYLATASATYNIYVIKDGQANLKPFWIDGLQCESDTLTTYLDGSLTGFVRNRADYYWTGTPHASTSVRIGQSRSGGKVISLNDLGFRLLSIIGLGMGGIVNQLTPLARGGAYYGGTVIADRQFSLVGQVDDSSGYLQLVRKRQALIDLFKPDVVSPVQPVTLRYIPTDDCGNQQGNEQEIVCLYQDGMSGRVDNLNAERLALQFQLYLPFVMQEVGNAGATLGYYGAFTAAYHAARIAGQWGALGTGFNGTVRAILVDSQRNRIYFAGEFTTANGVTVNRITYWDVALQTFVAMDSGVNATHVFAMALAPNGDVWIGGDFTTVGAAATATKGIAKWSLAGSSWSIISNTASVFTAIYAMAVDDNGLLYAAGKWTTYAGVANTRNIFKYDGASVTALGTGTDLPIYALLVGLNGTTIYLGGNFTTGNAVPLPGIGYWNGTTFVAMGTVNMQDVHSLAIDQDGNIYASGIFTSPGLRIAKWNGTAWSALGTGLNDSAWSMTVSQDGILYVGGLFTTAGGLTTPDRVAGWNGSAWFPLDIDLPGTPNVYAVASIRNDLYLGFDTTGSSYAATLTTITNTGSATSSPRVTLTGPGTVYQLTNYTTGKTIYFNLTLNVGETAVLDLSSPSNITFVSTFRGNLLNTILAGSQLSDFALAPGANIISLFISGTVTAATAADAQWRITTHSIDSAIPGRLLP